jgi:glycosyltransferase involved in cell wall biosynthesis
VNSKSTPAVCIIDENETVPFDRRVWLESRALADAGFEVSVICPVAGIHKAARETLEGVNIYRYRAFKAESKLGYLLEYAWALIAQFCLTLRVYAKTRFKILHACNPPDTVFLIALFFKPLGVRFVFDHHDLSPELYALRFRPGGFLYRMVCLAEWLSLRTADAIIATNESFREVAMQRGGVSPDRIVVVQTCAELRSLKETVPVPELKGKRRHMVVYAGQMEPQDGLDLLMASIRYVAREKNYTDVLFALLGDGSELHRLRSLADQWGLNEYIRFTGRIPHSEVCTYLATADVCVAPDPLNPMNDNCSMIKIFEYMGYGKPVVLFELKEGRRTADGAAVFARPNDPQDFGEQIIKLLDRPYLREELGKRGRRHVVERLNWENEQRKLIATYESLCGVELEKAPVQMIDRYEDSSRKEDCGKESVRQA